MISLLDLSVLFVKVLIIYLIYDRFLKWWYLRLLYARRGVTFVSKVPTPIVGDYLEFVRRVLAEPDRPQFTKWLREVFNG